MVPKLPVKIASFKFPSIPSSRDIPATPLFTGHCGHREFDGWMVSKAAHPRKVAVAMFYVFLVCLMDALHSLITEPELGPTISAGTVEPT